MEDGPKIHIEEELSSINAITKVQLNLKLFKHEKYELFNYPIAENSAEYTKATLELYRLIIDSMLKDCLKGIADHQGIQLTDDNKRLNSLKEILPIELVSIVYQPIKKVSDKRQPIHGIVSYPAFFTFNSDLVNISNALKEFRKWLEELFDLSSKSCKSRLESLDLFPKIVGPPRPYFKMDRAIRMVGKTISKVEFGEAEFQPDTCTRETMNIFFTDGSVVNMRIGSNVCSISGKCKDLKSEDFITDLMMIWADSPNKKKNKRHANKT